MKIGIDAKWFFEGPPSGRVVIRNLVKHLIDISKDDQLYLFLDRKQQGREFPYQASNVHLVYVWAGNNMLSNIFSIPLSAWGLNLDIVIFQNFTPIISNFTRYAHVHCILFDSNPEYFTLRERLYFKPLKFTTKLAHKIGTVSNYEKEKMVKYGYGTNNKIDVIYHGIDKSFFSRDHYEIDKIRNIQNKYSLPGDYILFVGRLNIVKNISNLIRSLSFLRSNIPLVVVGEYDWKMRNLDQTISELGLRDRLIFTGSVYGDDLPIIYSLAKVFCFPSYEESFGLPALEAMASGVPVVVSNRAALPEICGDAALYADPENPKDIASQIDRLLNDNNLWQEMSKLGLDRSKDFTWQKSAEELLKSAYIANK